MYKMKHITLSIIILVIFSGCIYNTNSKCIDNLVLCKSEFNIVREEILTDNSIVHNELVKYNRITQAMNTELNLLLQKARQNKGKPFKNCDVEVNTFCDDVDKLQKIYNIKEN